MEDYKEKYEQAMLRMSKWVEGSEITDPKEVAEFVFPELKESEDERIRKSIIRLIQRGGYMSPKDKDKAYAWLEKQGEYNMNISEATKKKLEDNLHKVLEKETPESYNKFLEKQGEQNPTDKVEPKFKVGDSIRYKNSGAVFTIKSVSSDHYSLTNNDGFLYFMFQDKYELVEQKPTWSEEDEHCIELLLPIIDSSSLIPKNRKKCKKFLKSLKERVQPQPNQEWSEEEKARIDKIIDVLDWAEEKGRISYSDWEDYVCYVKSLRPQYTWKPSDEQMKALEYYMNVLNCNEHKEVLFGLYEQLKSL